MPISNRSPLSPHALTVAEIERLAPGTTVVVYCATYSPPTREFEYLGIEGESVLLALDMAGIAASSGSACTTGALEPSHVLTAMGIDADLAHASLRLTLGTDNDEEQIGYVLEQLPGIVGRLRSLGGG